MKSVKIWTDGSATLKDNKLGGSGVYMVWDDGRELMLSKGWENTKTGRAEIHAFLLALQHLENEPISATFYMDSEYVMKSVLEYMPSWLENNWMGYAGPVKNRDLWEKVLTELNRTEKVLKSYVHVKGHQDNLDNEIVLGNNVADYLASYKNQNGYELDIPLKEEKKLKLYYFYDMDNDEVYADRVKRETHHISVGECKKDSVDEVSELWQEGERYLDFGHTFHYIGTRPSTKNMCYYLHRPSKTYFVDERGKDFGNDNPGILPVGDCVESTEFELFNILNRDHKLLAKTFENYKMRKEIVPDNEDLPF